MHIPDTIKKIHALLIIVMIFVVLSELFLLNQIFHLKKRLSDYSHLELLLSQTRQQLSQLSFLRGFEGKSLPITISQILNASLKSHSSTKKTTYAILFCFLQSDCSSCLFAAIADWNKFHTLCEQKNCQVIGLTDTTGYGNLKSIGRSLNIRFPLVNVPDLKNLLHHQGISMTPISFFVDLTLNKIIYANASLPYSESNSEPFIKKLQTMFDECK